MTLCEYRRKNLNNLQQLIADFHVRLKEVHEHPQDREQIKKLWTEKRQSFEPTMREIVERLKDPFFVAYRDDIAKQYGYTYVGPFRDGRAVVTHAYSDHKKFIDEDGNEVTGREYVGASDFSEGVALVASDVVVKDDQGRATGEIVRRVFFVDRDENPINDLTFEQAGDMHNGVAVVQPEQGDPYRILKKDGTFLTEDWYEDAKPASEGVIAVQKFFGHEPWTFVNLTDPEKPYRSFVSVHSFVDERAVVESDGFVGDPNTIFIINRDGNQVSGMYAFIQDLSEGLAWAQEEANFETTLKLLDKDGKVIFDGKDSALIGAHPFSHGTALVKDATKWWFVDRVGKKISDQTYSDVLWDQDGIAFVEQENEKFLVDHTGRRITAGTLVNARKFVEDRAWIEDEMGCKLIDRTGKVVFESRYGNMDESSDFSGGVAKIWDSDEEGGGYFYIDRYRKRVFEKPRYYE